MIRKFAPGRLFVILVYCLVTLVLAFATFYEYKTSTAVVNRNVYGSIWFVVLWGIFGCATIITFLFRKYRKHFHIVLLHLSFVVILCGALATYLGGKRGYVHIRQGESTIFYTESGTNALRELPFSIYLQNFKVAFYPGTTAPSDYISNLQFKTAHGTEDHVVSMNNIANVGNYRFYQTSFDEDQKGTWLSVNYDPWGIGITYTGYILLALSICCMLWSHRGTFRGLLSHPLLKERLLVLLLFLVGGASAASARPVLSRASADSIAIHPIVYQNRIAPFNTMARDVLQKIYGKSSYNGLSPEQVIGSWILYPEEWKNEPFIHIKNRQLCQALGLQRSNACLADFYDAKGYKLERLWTKPNPQEKQSSYQKAISETDEKIALLVMLRKGTLFQRVPPQTAAVSSTKLKAELVYNRLSTTKWMFMTHLTLGILAFVWFLHGQFRRKFLWIPYRIFRWLLLFSGTYLTCLLALRGYVSGHLPMTNGYETMVLVSWCIVLISFLLYKKSTLIPAAGFILSGFTLLVSSISSMSPQITSLMPVLASPWLSSHVSLIMIAYALLAFVFFNGITAVILHLFGQQSHVMEEKLYLISKILLYPAIGCLAIGIFIGAVWANFSWGRYWAWDPKEVWALVSLLVYAAPFHQRFLPFLNKPMGFHYFAIAAFSTILMTYFGVNYLLGGMHSYAN